MFGQSFGSSNTNSGTPFGQSTGFGQPAQNSFGQPATQQTQQAFGGSAFGQSLGSGQQNGAQSAFGQSVFGQPPPASGSLFGAKPATSTGVFGGLSTPSTGTAPTGSFGAPTSLGTAGSQPPGTGHTPFRAPEERDINKADQTNVFQVITMMPEYERYSFEELRWADYQENRTQPTQGSIQPLGGAGNSLFGASSNSATQPTTPFGQQQKQTFGFGAQQPAGFGQTTTSTFNKPPAFGQTSNSAFGQPAGGSSLFGGGATQQSSPFGQQAQQPAAGSSLFGQNKPAGSLFGQSMQQQPQQQTSLFGQPQQQQASGMFGQNNTSNAPAGNGLFGQSAAQQPGQSNGLFGQANNSSAFGQQKPVFGQSLQPQGQQPGNGSLFGQQSSAQPASSGFGFGQPPQQQQQTAPNTSSGSIFGQNPSANGGSSLFGNANSSGSTFGQPQTQQTVGAPFGTKPGGLFGSSTNSGFGQPSGANTSTGTGLFGQYPANTGQQPSSTQSGFSLGQTQQQNNGGLFGAKPAAPAGTGTGLGSGLFGQSNTTASSSAPSGGLFGQQAQPQTQGNSFGAKPAQFTPAGGLFGNTNNTTNTLGSANSGNTGSGLFGNASNANGINTSGSGGLFGNTGNNTTGPQKPLGLFGSTTNQNNGTGNNSFSFGGTPSTQQQNGIFNNNNSAGNGLFGKPTTAAAPQTTNPYGSNPLFSTNVAAPNMASANEVTSHNGKVPPPLATPINGSSQAEKSARTGVLVAASLRPRLLPARVSPVSDRVGTKSGSTSSSSPSAVVETSAKSHDALWSTATDEIIIASEAFAPQRRPLAIMDGATVDGGSINGGNASMLSPMLQDIASSGRDNTNADGVEPPATSTPTRNTGSSGSGAGSAAIGHTGDDEELPDNEIVDANGYWVSPSQARLDCMQLRELRAVRLFRVGHKEFGFVEFEDPVDLSEYSNVHAQVPGRIVAFADKTFSLYPVVSERPPKGQGFNVRHQVTLYNVFARSRDTQEAILDAAHPVAVKFLKRLKAMAPFVSWDAHTGTWTFRIEPQ